MTAIEPSISLAVDVFPISSSSSAKSSSYSDRGGKEIQRDWWGLLLADYSSRRMTSISPSISRLHSPFLCCPLKTSSSSHFSLRRSSGNQRSIPSYPCVRADLDQDTIVAISVGVVSVAVGIGIPIFYETQIDNAAKRENTQPCFPCNGSGAQKCRLCLGTGTVTVELGGSEKEVSKCINCDGVGSLTCTTCQGSGIQPRYLDRREFKDDD